MSAPVCPYCGQPALLVDSSIVYGKSYGYLWLCSPCQARVGCHKHSPTHEPLGTLANAALRALRTRVHQRLDPLWKTGVEVDGAGCGARTRVYTWLAAQMRLSPDECHIGKFDESRCTQALAALTNATWETVRDAVPVR